MITEINADLNGAINNLRKALKLKSKDESSEHVRGFETKTFQSLI